MLAPVPADPASLGVAADFGAVVADAGASAAASCFAAFLSGFAARSGFMGASCCAAGASCFVTGASGFCAGAGRSTALFGGLASPVGPAGLASPAGRSPFFPGACFFAGEGEASASGCCAIAAPASASEQLMSNVVNLIISMCLVVESVCCIQPAEPVFPRSAQQSPNETSCIPGHSVPPGRAYGGS